MQFSFCPECGRRLIRKQIGDEGEIPYCEACERPWFSVSYPCVICLATDGKGRFALIKQTYATKNYVCVAGFIKERETAEQTAVREIQEEIGLKVLDIRFVSSYYYPKHDNLMLGFACTVEPGEFRLSGEVERAGWFSLEQARELLSHGTVGKDLLRDYLKMR